MVFFRVLLVLNDGFFEVVILMVLLVFGLWLVWVVCVWIWNVLKLISVIVLLFFRVLVMEVMMVLMVWLDLVLVRLVVLVMVLINLVLFIFYSFFGGDFVYLIVKYLIDSVVGYCEVFSLLNLVFCWFVSGVFILVVFYLCKLKS